MGERLAALVCAATAVLCGCGGDDQPGDDQPGPDPDLIALYDDDSADRVHAHAACTDVTRGMQRTVDGAAPISALLPGSVTIAATEPSQLDRGAAAQRYVMAVIDGAFRARLAEVQQSYVAGMSAADLRIILGVAWRRDTLVPLAPLADELAALCADASPRLSPSGDGAAAAPSVIHAGPPAGPGGQGYACPRAPTPDCAADPPAGPWGCPPTAPMDCPDCPGLEEAEADLERLEELFELAHEDDTLNGILDALVGALQEALESGELPTPAALVQQIVLGAVGAQHPAIGFYIDLLTSTIEGTLAGGPIGGMASLAWAFIMGWGDFQDGLAEQQEIEDARRRAARLRDWCVRIQWADKQEACRQYEQALFTRRTAECGEAAASYDAALAGWELDQAACDAERDAVARANDAASSWTARLQGGPFAFTPEAFELCCDQPLGGPRCPEAGSTIDPVPYPPWSTPVGYGPLALTGSGVIALRAGTDHTGAQPWLTGIAGASAIGAAPGRPEVLLAAGDRIFEVAGGGDFTGATPWATFPAGTFITDVTWLYGRRQWAVTDLVNGRIWLLTAGGDHPASAAHATGLQFPVAVGELDDGTLLAALNGRSGLVDIGAGGNLAAAPLYRDLQPWAPQHFVRIHDGTAVRMLVTAAQGDGSGAVFDVLVAGGPRYTGIFNPAGIAADPWSGQTLACSFSAAGSVFDLSAAPDGDLSNDAPFATGLANPDGLAWVPLPITPPPP